ncbi:hypothetical protein M2232_003050 [Bradyrhizobium japonicum]|uniref:TraY domain-containing protein n=1 Tax=Bradyrhizobium japonicum TaxID=375 RepID=UPI00222746CA|nr:TraY domain-containing protein [Bradyrhizobium japonicum]MCW2219518.1 hypothetical protein [Bradyrhizobium japonicum]MCW2344132.1 hypothetical protein [Bradyrhizobium japonicum]
MQQVKIGLTPKQRGALEVAANRNGRTLSEEVRLRLETSLQQDELSGFARTVGQEVSMIVQIVQLSAAVDAQGQGQRVDELSEGEQTKIKSVMWRAAAVAVNDYFTEIKARALGIKIDPPPTEPDVKADAIGHSAAQALFVWTSGGNVPSDSRTSWLFEIRNEMESRKSGRKT